MLLQLQGNTVEVANHHSASRVIQWCLKEGSTADKDRLLGEVKANIVSLSRSKYGRHVVQKVISMSSKEEVPGRYGAVWGGRGGGGGVHGVCSGSAVHQTVTAQQRHQSLYGNVASWSSSSAMTGARLILRDCSTIGCLCL